MDILSAKEISGRCYNQEDGARLFSALRSRLAKGDQISVSFSDIDTVPSSFVNAALIALLDEFTFDQIKAQLKFTDTTRQINEMIRMRFEFETSRHKR